MKIDFEKIIERADVRKEQLMKLQALMAEAEDRYADLMAVRNWADDLSNVYAAIDDEGRKMLPPNVWNVLAGINSTMYHLTQASVNGMQGLLRLLPEDSE